MRLSIRRAGALLVVAATLTACSSPPTPDQQQPPAAAGSGSPAGARNGAPDPCGLLTTAEVSAATGHSAADGAINLTVSQARIKACDWTAAGTGTVQVLVSDVDAFASSRETAGQIYGVTSITVPGASDAYVVTGGFLIGMDVAPYFVQVSYVTVDPNVEAVTRDLAARVAGRSGPPN